MTEFAQKEVAPRATEIDKTNNFPSVRYSFEIRPPDFLIHFPTTGPMGEVWFNGPPWNNG